MTYRLREKKGAHSGGGATPLKIKKTDFYPHFERFLAHKNLYLAQNLSKWKKSNAHLLLASRPTFCPQVESIWTKFGREYCEKLNRGVEKFLLFSILSKKICISEHMLRDVLFSSFQDAYFEKKSPQSDHPSPSYDRLKFEKLKKKYKKKCDFFHLFGHNTTFLADIEKNQKVYETTCKNEENEPLQTYFKSSGQKLSHLKDESENHEKS